MIKKNIRKELKGILSLCNTLSEGTRHGKYWQEGVLYLLDDVRDDLIGRADSIDYIQEVDIKYNEENQEDYELPIERLYTLHNTSRSTCKKYWNKVIEEVAYYERRWKNEKISRDYKKLLEEVEKLDEYMNKVDMKCINATIPFLFHIVGRIIKEVLTSLYRDKEGKCDCEYECGRTNEINKEIMQEKEYKLKNTFVNKIIKELLIEKVKVNLKIHKKIKEMRREKGRLRREGDHKLKGIVKGIIKERTNEIDDKKVRKEVKKRVKRWARRSWGNSFFK